MCTYSIFPVVVPGAGGGSLGGGCALPPHSPPGVLFPVPLEGIKSISQADGSGAEEAIPTVFQFGRGPFRKQTASECPPSE